MLNLILKIMNEQLFEKVEEFYINNSITYERCRAFRKALAFVEKHDREEYKKIITIGFEESFDYNYLEDEED